MSATAEAEEEAYSEAPALVREERCGTHSLQRRRTSAGTIDHPLEDDWFFADSIKLTPH